MNKSGTRMQIRLHVNGHSWLNKIGPRDPEGHCGGGGVGLGVTYLILGKLPLIHV